VIIVNFKRYPEADGERAVLLAGICKKLTQELNVPIIPVPQEKDLEACAAIGIDCWTQKFVSDPRLHNGTLLNHSDFRLSLEQLKQEVDLSRSRGDKVCVCTATLEETVAFLQLNPDLLAYEPPELIGSQTTSVALAEPEVIGRSAEACLQIGIPLLVGAGVKSANDVTVSLKQGAVGILVASAVVQASNPEEKLRELAQAFNMRA
jgi:triosephosphate isomerase (TIM)